ncbi:hypothetical protein ACQP0C_05600 [Nocardia sp. CA-129566]|uniref:hypothetical protein n=1 Tax=Nocardia sp. CA-129566 TaxID=3239976 RepID=UPI003D99A6FF
MKWSGNKIVATALLAIAATGLAAGTTTAQPLEAPTTQQRVLDPSVPVIGADHGIGYTMRFAADAKAVTTTLDSGAFTATADGIAIADNAGQVVTTVPLVFPAKDRDIALQPIIDHDGKALTLRPIDDPAPQPTTSQERWNQEVQRASFGALIGAGIGLIIGLPLGGIILFPIPMATVAIGASIGFLAVGGQPLIDAGIAYFTGQP